MTGLLAARAISHLWHLESLSGKFRYRNQTNILILSWSNFFSEMNIQIQSWSEKIASILQDVRGGTGSGLPESTPAGFCVFLSDPESKIREKPDADPESLFNFGSSRSLCGHVLNKNMWNYSWIDDCSRSLNRNRILKIERFTTLPYNIVQACGIELFQMSRSTN